MTQLLEQAFAEASALPELQQNIVARWIMAELQADQRWDALFAESEDILADLADEALREFEQGETHILDVDTL